MYVLKKNSIQEDFRTIPTQILYPVFLVFSSSDTPFAPATFQNLGIERLEKIIFGELFIGFRNSIFFSKLVYFSQKKKKRQRACLKKNKNILRIF